MPDPGAFERLALACLRHLAAEECASLIHGGINPEGKSANSRLDAFTRVPWSTPASFVGAAFTTEKKAKLQVKWLGTAATPRRRKRRKTASTRARRKHATSPLDADLPKALRVAADLQTKFPDARFKLFLVTNRSVSEDLQTAVHQAAAANSAVTVEFVEQTRLRDFLDLEREGQFLRQEFLGIPATRVSRSLLAACGRGMINDRRRQPDLAEAHHLISRPIQESVRTACASTPHALVWLVAEPGKGKTLAAIAELRRHQDAGGVALWLNETDVAHANSLEEAILSALRRLKPNLHYDDASEVLSFFSPSDRLLVLVDDLNRTNDPPHLLARIHTWATHLAGDGTKTQEKPEPSVVLLCPVWQRHRKAAEAKPDNPTESAWECSVVIDDFTAEEAESLLALAQLSAEARETVHRLAGGEPYLTGWLAHTFTTAPTRTTLAKRPSLDELLDERLQRVTTKKKHRARGEFSAALVALGGWMLRSHQLTPSMDVVVAAFRDSAHLPVLRELIGEESILYQAHSLLRFTHDRLREIWLTRALPAVIDLPEVYGEPHFAEIIGGALADDRLSQAQLCTVARSNPLALFCAWQWLGPRADAPWRPHVLEAIRAWLREFKPEKDRWDPLTWEITKQLELTDAPEVLEFSECLPPRPLLLLAALKNGSAAAGRRYVERRQRVSFPPDTDDPRFDQALADAVRKHRIGLVADVAKGLRNSDASNDQREASILLAGFLALPECGASLVETWHAVTSEQRQGWVGAYLWATARCLGDGAKTAWESGLETWLSLSPNAAPPHSSSPRWQVVEWQLGRIRTPWLHDGLATWLATLTHAGHPLHPELSAVLEDADTPAAVEFVVRKQGERRRLDPKSSGLGLWLSVRRSGRHGEKLKLSAASLARLHAIWSADHEPKDDREAALAFWCAATDGAELHQLFALPPDSFLQSTALFQRMKLRDATCVPLVIKHLTDRPHWLRMLPSVWTRALLNAVDQLLDDDNSSVWPSDLYELLIAIPPGDAEFLILAHDARLRSMPEILQAAVLAGTPRLHAWVRDVAQNSAELRAKIFEHIELQIATTRPHHPPLASTKCWLHNLEPFLDWLPVKELENLMRDWHPKHHHEWAQRHVLPRLPEELRAKHARPAETLVAQTSDLAGKDQPEWMSKYFLERAKRRGWQDAAILDVLQGWAEQRCDDFSFTWLASCIARVGTRADLKRLEALLSLRTTATLERIFTDTDFSVRRRLL